MRRIVTLAALSALTLPVPALAQDAAVDERAAEQLADTLRNPVVQDQMAGVVAAMSEALLDMDLSPMAEAVAKATGEELPEMERGRTLREMSPGAEQLPETIDRELPRAMDRMADMGDAFALMLPALRDMAEQMGRAVEKSVDSAR